ncbi:hypothetical protein GCM10007387_18510 [Pseudoduganella albidiflava]|uniref:Uncharacterized protein n=1 Tax=Pseudoduganella albidiflava TaxID=321983 RepID=A0AA88C0A9_9BURK|nr:hypothetical protein GCM10007387_18510 [Pseudoduganella albidiflava]
MVHAVAAVIGVIDRVARFGQALLDEAGDPFVVFDEEEFHGVLICFICLRVVDAGIYPNGEGLGSDPAG